MRQKSDLHPYQQSAIDWIYDHDHSMALCPVGSGKTAITWTAITELMDDGHVERPIVFAPLRVAQLVWAQEREQWAHLKGRSVVLWGGEPDGWADGPWKQSRLLWGSRQYLAARIPAEVDVRKRRVMEDRLEAVTTDERKINKRLKHIVPPKAVHVISYENLLWLCELYTPGGSPFDMWVFDECGRLKNPKSPRYKAVRKHTKEAKLVVGLNATPAPEGLLDLYTQVTVVDGGKLFGKSFYQWRQKYFVPSDWMGYSWRPQLGARDLILKDLNSIAFRVDEADLAYQRQMTHTKIEFDLPPKARAAYVEMERQMAVELDGRDDLVAMSAAASSMKLRQISNGFIYDEAKRPIILHEEKQHALADLIDDMGREPLLVAYLFLEDLDAIRRIWKGVPYLGQGLSADKVKDHIERWNRRELPVLALHPYSAGHGLNLQAGGSHIAWYGLPWDLEAFQQTNGRIDRQGQLRACYAHHIIARDTIDLRVSALLTEKATEQDEVIRAVRTL